MQFNLRSLNFRDAGQFAIRSGMARAHAILQSEFPYNIGSRCINREWFSIPMEKVWQIFCEELAEVSVKRNLLIHSFVLMSNHFHLIASTPDANVSQCMQNFMSKTSRRLNLQGNRINETFAGRHFKCILTRHTHYLNAYKYNYRNPVAAGLCESAQHYPFSTLNFLVSGNRCPIPLVEDLTYYEDPVGTLEWLNTPPDQKKLDAVKVGLHRQYFSTRRKRNSHFLEVSDEEII